MTAVDELIAFVLRCLDEVEADADAVHDQDACDNAIARGHDACTCRWPKLIRADVEAKRRILDEHRTEDGCCYTCSDKRGDSVERAPCPTVRLLAQPCAGRDGWREEWAT